MSRDKVGRGKPPKHTQFKKGRSGNPKGRPKSSLNTSTIMRREMSSPITIQENGKTRRVSKREALLMRLMSEALKGSHKAFAAVLALEDKAGPEPSERRTEPYSKLDLAIIKKFAPRILSEIENSDDEGDDEN